MKAMVFAAGMGTRLQPYTNTKPKALVEVGGIPMLEIILKKIIRYGFNEIIINVYHFSDQIIDFLKKNNNFGASITISDESGFLLDTGGGLLKARYFFDDGKPFLVHNIDILTNIDLNQLYQFHNQNNALATLAVKDRSTSRSFLIDSNNELCGWKNHQTGQIILSKGKLEELSPIAFSCVHVINPEIFPLFSETGKFSITDTYLRLAKENKIMTFRHDNDFWYDMGRTELIKYAEPYINLI
jgi:NDP-sugar pyrophosphorylase family protein